MVNKASLGSLKILYQKHPWMNDFLIHQRHNDGMVLIISYSMRCTQYLVLTFFLNVDTILDF